MKTLVFLLCLLGLVRGISIAQEQTPYDIALERILESEASDATILDLSELGLTELPPEIGNLSTLMWLALNDNELGHLPNTIGNLINLEELRLYNNELISLPTTIGNLANLEALYLSNNKLSSLPDEIGNLSNLERLILHNNELNSLPSEIGNLSSLCSLFLGENPMQHLPIFLSELRLLRLESAGCILDLSDNNLISPSPEVIEQGTPTIFYYLNNRVWWHFQRLMPSLLSGLGVIVLVILGLRYRQRGQRKPKQKRGDIS